MIEWDFDIDELGVTDFPFRGYVYTLAVDMEKPLDERVPEEIVVLAETDVDIQRAAKLHNGSLNGADYTVYYKLSKGQSWYLLWDDLTHILWDDGTKIVGETNGADDKYGPITIRRGMFFRGWAYGYTIEGEVEIIRPSQLGGVSFDVKVKKESNG